MRPSDSIKAALEVLGNQALRIVVVVDSYDRLLGVVTDGDIRRGLLSGVGLDESIVQVMVKTPISADITASNEDLVKLMNDNDILSIPLLDNGKVVGVETLHNTLNTKESIDSPVFIMAGGFGTRLRPLTNECPKPMLELADDYPMLRVLIEQFKQQGFWKFFISTHFLPEKIHSYFGNGEKFGVEITYLHEDQPLGTGGALSLLPESAYEESPIILINGDILTQLDFSKLLSFHNRSGAEATMCVREFDYQIPYGVVSSNEGKLNGFKEKPVETYTVNAGIYVLSKKILTKVSSSTKIDLPSLLEQTVENHGEVRVYPFYDYWLDIGRMEDFKRARRDFTLLKR
ncbi:nucleotidyltransferase family protein [Litoribacillus peritrichatus]|uniref:Nucleotidyltransferase family protein n=2 Tax=Litoribacillus peritrichatus TaxID=718191 RepID=A0ABP7M308_9GAMM